MFFHELSEYVFMIAIDLVVWERRPKKSAKKERFHQRPFKMHLEHEEII